MFVCGQALTWRCEGVWLQTHRICLSYILRRQFLLGLKSPRGRPSILRSLTHTHTHARPHAHTRPRTRTCRSTENCFRIHLHICPHSSKRPLYRSLLMFLLSAVQILWLARPFCAGPEFENVATAGSGFMIVHNLNRLALLTPNPASTKWLDEV